MSAIKLAKTTLTASAGKRLGAGDNLWPEGLHTSSFQVPARKIWFRSEPFLLYHQPQIDCYNSNHIGSMALGSACLLRIYLLSKAFRLGRGNIVL